MLRRVLAELGQPAEILLVFDARAIDEVRVKDVAAELTEGARGAVDVVAVPTDGLRYYQLKNEGIRRSRGDILLFVDSDVIPDDGWLRTLIGSFRDPAIQVVMANPYVEADSLYGKAFALAWYFPSRPPGDRPTPTTHSFANSIAFRRETIQRHPFPDDRELYISVPGLRGDAPEDRGRGVHESRRPGPSPAAGSSSRAPSSTGTTP
jgi:Glycosyl transferase family 2